MCHLFPVALRPGLGPPSLSFLPGVMKGSLCPPANALGCLWELSSALLPGTLNLFRDILSLAPSQEFPSPKAGLPSH